MTAEEIRHDWTLEEIEAYYHQPLLEMVYAAAAIHRRHHNPRHVQICHVISVKTGGCPEDCSYCAQSSRYKNLTPAERMMPLEKVMEKVDQAIRQGATRICLAAGWRAPRPGKAFDQILEMVQRIRTQGVEVCCTLGMLQLSEAERLKSAGLYAYNHNIDTSRAHYPNIATTRSFQDRLDTLDVVESSQLSVCCGGILGVGESLADRFSFLQTLANRPRHPESLPLNLLEKIPGTLLENAPLVPAWELVRLVAMARYLMPKAKLRLSGGRKQLTAADQALCFLAGANSIHSGEKLLTVSTCSFSEDKELFSLLGLLPAPAFQQEAYVEH